jgi:hypothetical protein
VDGGLEVGEVEDGGEVGRERWGSELGEEFGEGEVEGSGDGGECVGGRIQGVCGAGPGLDYTIEDVLVVVGEGLEVGHEHDATIRLRRGMARGNGGMFTKLRTGVVGNAGKIASGWVTRWRS